MVADAPHVRALKVQALSELDQDVMFQMPSGTDNGVDLSLLTAVLYPHSAILEPDEPWDVDLMLTDLAAQAQVSSLFFLFCLFLLFLFSTLQP